MADGRRGRLLLAAAAGALAAGGVAAAVALTPRLRRAGRRRRCAQVLLRWTATGPEREPVVDCEVPIEHGASGEDVDYDVVEVPVGLLFECERVRAALRERLGAAGDEELVEALEERFRRERAAEEEDVEEEEAGAGQADQLLLQLPWVDLAALAQLTYWYDRRPAASEEASHGGEAVKDERATEARFGRWTKKLTSSKVVYGAVALRYRTRGHLGAEVFRRPAGIDVTRLATLQRAASLCGHDQLLEIVEKTMERLKPRNVARIPWAEVRKHNTKDDLWLLIDGKVYDVTPFLDLHPGGGQLIADASGKDSTVLFEQTHGEGLRYSLRLLNQFFIGMCEGPEEAEPASEGTATAEFLSLLRSITGALHTFDEAKATGQAQGLLR